MEEMHRTKYGERAWSFHVLSKLATLPESPRTHQPGSSLLLFQEAKVIATQKNARLTVISSLVVKESDEWT